MSATRPIASRFTRAKPCPVCGSGSKGCSSTDDGLFLCRGDAQDGFRRVSRSPDAAGFEHYRRDDGERPERNGHAPHTPPAVDWHDRAQQHAEALDQTREELAALLGLPVAALSALPLLGWLDSEQCWLFPECDSTGRAIGITRRFAAGTKRMMTGGKRGLTIPAGWRDRSGPLLLVEGASDVLALSLCGLAAIGRPSNTGGVELLAELLRDFDPARPIIVVGENDRKESGEWPGRLGAERTAEALTRKLGRTVRFAMPPADAKDCRAWFIELVSGTADVLDYFAIGETIRQALIDAAEPREAASRFRWPEPVPISLLPDAGPAAEWLWYGCIARGHVTMFSALMKCGKTTLIGHALRAFQHGVHFLDRDVKQCRTLIVTEESEAIWRGRRDALALDDHVHLICRPFLSKPTLGEWLMFVEEVAAHAIGNFDLVILDTISAFAPWKSENDSAEVMATLTPLNRLTKAGLAVLLFHHHGKTDSHEGRAARGSTALAAAADILLELRRFKPDDMDDRRRVLAGMGRFDEIPTEIVIALAEDGSAYTAEGDKKCVKARELADAVRIVLPDALPGKTADEVHADLPEDVKPRRGDVMKVLRAGADAGEWQSSGSGRPKDPRRFWRG